MTPLDIAIDVSDAQGRIDWGAVAGAGIRIAFVKATEGADFTARSFERNRRGAAAAGIAVVPYHYLRPDGVEIQVMRFLAATGLEPGAAFALDWEGRASRTCTPDTAEAVGTILAAHSGRPPLGYWGIPGATPAPPTPAMLSWDRWVPRYPRVGIRQWTEFRDDVAAWPDRWWPSSKRRFAQYTCWGRIPGITGPVDRSVAFFASVAAALAWADGGAGRPPGAGNTPAASAPPASAADGSAATTEAQDASPADRLNAEELAQLSLDPEGASQ